MLATERNKESGKEGILIHESRDNQYILKTEESD